MALDTTAVETVTGGRLDRDDPEAARQLAAALAAARSYCGWHVSPVIEDDEVTLDGPGGPVLMLPTLQLQELTSIVEEGVSLDLTKLDYSPRGMVVKYLQPLTPVNWNTVYREPRPWNHWTGRLGGITATMTHGYSEPADFESAVLSAIERGGFTATTQLVSVGPFRYDTLTMAAGSAFSAAEQALLAKYRLEPAA